MSAQTIAISQIDASDRLRPVDPLTVDAYAAIAEQRINEGLSPLIQPIIVRPTGVGYKLISGAHRLEVLRAIGRKELIVGDDVVIRAESDDGARDSEIFENLADAGLTALDRAIFLSEAKQRADAKRRETRGRRRQIDASPADVMCVDGRHSVYLCVDIFSRRLIVYVSKTPRAEAVALLIRRAILAWGVPERVHTDNGSDLPPRARNACSRARQKSSCRDPSSRRKKAISNARIIPELQRLGW